MNTEKPAVIIDKCLMPDYYPEFHCLMGACRDNCCRGGWNISFSKKDYLKLKKAVRGTELESLEKTAVRRFRGKAASEEQYAHFSLNQAGGCPLQSERGLCLLQLTCGEGSLPSVCRAFPRVDTHSPEGCLEQSCSLGCEEVLRLLYVRRDGLGFIEAALPHIEQYAFCFVDDGPMFQYEVQLRNFGIDVLQDRRMTLPERILFLGMTFQDLGRQMDGTTDLLAWLSGRRSMLEDEKLRMSLSGLQGNRRLFILNHVKLLQLILSNSGQAPARKSLVQQMLDLLGLKGTQDSYTVELDAYEQALVEFKHAFGDVEYFFENIVVNAFFQNGLLYFEDLEKGKYWDFYMQLCLEYSVFRFAAVCGCAGDEKPERLFHVLTVCTRFFMHSKAWQEFFVKQFRENNSATLAHMAILVQG